MSGARNSENSESEDRVVPRPTHRASHSSESVSLSPAEPIRRQSSSSSSLLLSPPVDGADQCDNNRSGFSGGGVSDGEQSRGSAPSVVLHSTPSLEVGFEVDRPLELDGSSVEHFPDNVSRSSESGRSVDFGPQRTPEAQPRLHDQSKTSFNDKIKSHDKKEKKKSSWYNMLNPTYKSKSDDFKRLFKDLPDTERLIVDYSCALQKDILVHGRLYVSQNYICFYANIFRWETFLSIRCIDVTSMTKEKTARVIPNAIQISTESEKHFFTSFGARDKTFLMLFRIWQHALMEQPMSSQQHWEFVHCNYGEELGLTSSDDDYVAPPRLKDVRVKDGGKEKSYDEKESELYTPPIDLEESGEANFTNEVEESPKSVDYIPTDMSDTTESDNNIEEEVEAPCPCGAHEGKEVLNAVFPLPVDQVFSLIFTGSKFYNDLLQSRKTYDIIESPWQLCPEFDLKMRQVTYTITLNHSMAKCAQTTETQRLLKHSRPGYVYTVECDVANTGIPYADAFTFKSVYCMTRVSRCQSRLCIAGGVHYKKSVWGLVKSLIEKSANQGLADFATDLATALEKEGTRKNETTSSKGRRRKRIKFDPPPLKDTPRLLQRQPTLRNIGSSISGIDLSTLGSTPDIVIRVILITLVILLFLNMLLFYKLWSLEDQSSKPAIPPSILEYVNKGLSVEEWAELVAQQEGLHRAETERWRDALTHVLSLVRLIEKSLSELKSSIDAYSSTAFLKSFQMAAQEEESSPPI